MSPQGGQDPDTQAIPMIASAGLPNGEVLRAFGESCFVIAGCDQTLAWWGNAPNLAGTDGPLRVHRATQPGRDP